MSVSERAQRVLARLDTSRSIFAVSGQAGVNPYRWQSVPLAMVRFATFRSAEGGYPAAVIACKRGSSTSATCAKPLAKETSRRVLRRQLNQAVQAMTTFAMVRPAATRDAEGDNAHNEQNRRPHGYTIESVPSVQSPVPSHARARSAAPVRDGSIGDTIRAKRKRKPKPKIDSTKIDSIRADLRMLTHHAHNEQ